MREFGKNMPWVDEVLKDVVADNAIELILFEGQGVNPKVDHNCSIKIVGGNTNGIWRDVDTGYMGRLSFFE